MKTVRILWILIPAMLLLESCSKEMKKYEGSYSFKTSGTMQWVKLQGQSENDSVYPDTLNVVLSHEMGQMNVVKLDRQDNRMMVTMNILGGGAYSVPATVSEDDIRLDTVLRQVSYRIVEGVFHHTDLEMTGVGHRYGNVLLFDLEFLGTGEYLGERYRIEQSAVECVAEFNE